MSKLKLDAFLEGRAGELMIGFGLVALGALMSAAKVAKGEDVIVAGLTLLARAVMVSPTLPPPPPKHRHTSHTSHPKS